MNIFLGEKQYNIVASSSNGEKYFSASALNAEYEKMGKILFRLDRDLKQVWINRVDTLEPFQHQGVATALITFAEYEGYKNGLKTVTGKYFPLNSFAKDFYLKNGYSFKVDGQEVYIFKEIDYNYVSNFVKPNIKNYEVQNKDEENLFQKN